MNFHGAVYPPVQIQSLIVDAMNGDDKAAQFLDRLPRQYRLGAIALAYQWWLKIGVCNK